MKRRITPLAVVLPLCVGLALATGPGYAGTAARTRSTPFAFQGSGYGSRVVGGQVPVGSDTTGYRAVGCTNKAGLDHENDVAQADLPGLGTAYGITSRIRTTLRKGVAATRSTHSITQVVLSQSGLGTLAIDAIRSRAVAFHDASGFHATTATSVGDITFTPPVGPAQTFPAPTPNQPVTIPGLATIYAGRVGTAQGAHDAIADAYALRVDVIPSGTSVRVAHTHARINDGVVSGLFGGRSAGTHVIKALGGVAKSGPNPLSLMPCQGTYGQVRSKALASVDLGGQVVASGISSAQRATQTAHRAYGYERGAVAGLSLGGGQVVVDGIVGKAHVMRDKYGVHRSAKGTTLGTVTVNGQTQTFPPTGVLEIPGVAKLERRVVTRTRYGLQVIGLRVTLLDGSGAVIDLGEAVMKIRPVGH